MTGFENTRYRHMADVESCDWWFSGKLFHTPNANHCFSVSCTFIYSR